MDTDINDIVNQRTKSAQGVLQQYHRYLSGQHIGNTISQLPIPQPRVKSDSTGLKAVTVTHLSNRGAQTWPSKTAAKKKHDI